MPKDLPTAVIVLIWLLSGVIVFGWLLMEYPTGYSFLFALVYFGTPILVKKMLKKLRAQP